VRDRTLQCNALPRRWLSASGLSCTLRPQQRLHVRCCLQDASSLRPPAVLEGSMWGSGASLGSAAFKQNPFAQDASQVGGGCVGSS